MPSAIITSVLTAGSNSHATVSSEGNAYATDFVSQGCLGSLTNSNGSAPAAGSFGVNQNTGSDMNLLIKGTGNTTNTQSTAYLTVTPTSQDKQVLRARMSADYTPYAINSNATGSTVFDWIYLKADPTLTNNPDAAADSSIFLFTSRSTSNASDNGSPPTYGILLAVVTVANGATAITNANIADKRTQVIFNTGGSTTTTGWQSVGTALTYGANNGNKEFTCTATGDLTGLLSPGMKMQVTRGVTPPTLSAAFASASSQYATKASPTGITFTSAFTCEGWVYLQSYTGGGQTIGGRFNGTNGFILQITASGQPILVASSTTFQTAYQSIPLNQWVHVAGTFSAGTMVIYINGALATSFLTGSGTSITQAGALQVGAANTTSFLNGYVSEFRIWSVAQTQANIQANMAKNLLGSETNLVGLWQFSGVGTDATSNANTLAATNGASFTNAANPYNAIEYANVRAVSFSNPTTTVTLYTGDAGTIPNQTLSNVEYSTAKEPFGLPEVLNSKILGQVIWGQSVTSTATSTGTPINGASMTMTIPTAGKKLVMKVFTASFAPGAGTGALQTVWGSVVEGQYNAVNANGAMLVSMPFWATSGSQTFTIDMYETSAGTTTFFAAITAIAWFTVEEA